MTDSALTPDLLTVRGLFEAETTYSVPVYQRDFAWESQQIEQLITDVWSACQDGNTGYFLGNLVVTAPSTLGEYSVVDGQQRLTTLYLLLTYLARFTRYEAQTGAHHVGRLRYESRPRSSETLRRIDGGFPEAAVANAPESELDAGILEAFNIIEQVLEQQFSEEQRNVLAAFLLDRVTLVRVSLPEGTDLNRYFEIMNTRGQQLQQVDIVKARLMARLNDDHDRACFAWVWDACADMNSYIQRSIALGDTGLRTRLFGQDWTWLAPTTFEEVREIYRARDHDTPTGQVGAEFVSMSLDDAMSSYSQVREEADADAADSERFRSTIEFPSLLLHILKVFLGESDESEGALDDKHLVKRFSAKFKNLRPEDIQRFCFTLLQCRHAFDTFILKREHLPRHEDDGEWSLQRALRRTSGNRSTLGYAHTYQQGAEEDDHVDATTRELIQLQSMLRITYTAPRGMHWITRMLEHLARRQARDVTAAELITLLRDFARQRVARSFFGEAELQGFEIPRIVFTYLDYLLVRSDRVPGFSRDFSFSFRTSIEHFYPQSPDVEQSGEAVTDTCLNLLGNLALVSVSANSKFSNSLPKAKAENFTQTIEQQSPKLSLMASITRDGRWSDRDVRAHHEEMVGMLREDLAS